MDDEGSNVIDLGSRGHRSRSTLPPPPARGCHALRCLVIFLFGIPCGYSVFSFQIKKTEEISGYIHEDLAKVKSIPSLQMHDLLEILEHAFSLLMDFSSIHI